MTEAVREGTVIVVLSDRNIAANRLPIHALFASGAVHQGLHGVRDRLTTLSDELVDDVMIGTDYLTRIARILGLG